MMGGMAYKAICFDHGGVLIGRPGPQFNQAVCALLHIQNSEFETVYFRHNKRPNLGEITWDELWPIVLEELGKSDELPQLRQLIHEFHEDRTPHPEMLQLVDTLQHNGYKTGLLSNNGPQLEQELVDQGIAQHFDVVHISALTGFVKPDPQAFYNLADALGVSLLEIIYIDDSTKSLSTAAECGYTPILFENYQQLVKDLQSLDVRLTPISAHV